MQLGTKKRRQILFCIIRFFKIISVFECTRVNQITPNPINTLHTAAVITDLRNQAVGGLCVGTAVNIKNVAGMIRNGEVQIINILAEEIIGALRPCLKNNEE